MPQRGRPRRLVAALKPIVMRMQSPVAPVTSPFCRFPVLPEHTELQRGVRVYESERAESRRQDMEREGAGAEATPETLCARADVALARSCLKYFILDLRWSVCRAVCLDAQHGTLEGGTAAGAAR